MAGAKGSEGGAFCIQAGGPKHVRLAGRSTCRLPHQHAHGDFLGQPRAKSVGIRPIPPPPSHESSLQSRTQRAQESSCAFREAQPGRPLREQLCLMVFLKRVVCHCLMVRLHCECRSGEAPCPFEFGMPILLRAPHEQFRQRRNLVICIQNIDKSEGASLVQECPLRMVSVMWFTKE